MNKYRDYYRDYVLMCAAFIAQSANVVERPRELKDNRLPSCCFDIAEGMADEAVKRGYLPEKGKTE